MGKKYLDTKEGSLEQSVLGVWQTAIDESDARMDGRTKEYREHRKKLESARLRREKKNLNKEEVELDETNKNDKSDDGEGMDAVQPKAIKKKFKDRKDKDIDNDGDVDSSDKYLHKRRKAVAKAISKQEEVELDEASVMVDLENDNKKLMSDIKKMGIKVKDLGDSGNPGYNEYKLTGSPAALKKGGKKFGWDQQTEEVKLDEAPNYSKGSVMVDLENDNPKLMKDIKKMGIKVKDLGDSGNPGYNEYKLTGSPAALKKGGKKFGWDQQVEKVQFKEGKMSQLHQLMKDGKTAEEIAKIMRLDAKTVKKLMAGYHESYEIGTDEYRKHTQDVTPGEDGEWVSAVNKKNESMREALARVWNTTEDKNPFKKESKKDLTKEVKDGKTMTGKKIASVEVNPKIMEKKK